MKYKTRNPFEIADDLNIDVKYDNLGTLKGFYFYQSNFRYIVINEFENRLKPIICAHELGHDRIHQNFAKSKALQEFSFFDMSSKPEREANLFMAELIVADDSMIELIKLGYSYKFVASEIGILVQIVDFKGQMMRKKGFDIKPFVETSADFLRYY